MPNAYYDPQLNSITFPAAILQPPLFDRQADDAANFAAIGAIIGHELTHGFDDQGRKFDGDGNLHDWWTADDGKEYERRAQCIADEYSGFEATEGVKLNGKLTLGENTSRQWRLANRSHGSRKHSFSNSAAYGFKQTYSAAGILHLLCGDMVLERNSAVLEHDDAIQSPFDRAGPRERCGIQYARIPESLRLQEGAAHGAGKRLSRLVEVRRRSVCC